VPQTSRASAGRSTCLSPRSDPRSPWRDASDPHLIRLLGAVSGLLDAGRLKLYCVDSYDAQSWSDPHHNSRFC